MTIRFWCPNAACKRALSAKDEFAGRGGHCAICGTAFTVPLESTRAPSSYTSQSPAAVRAAAQTVPRPETAPPSLQVPGAVPAAPSLRPTAQPQPQVSQAAPPLPPRPAAAPLGPVMRGKNRVVWLLPAAGGGVVLLIVLAAVLIASLARPSYRVTHRVVAAPGWRAALEVTVRGKARRLALLLTDPEGQTRTEFIEADDMMDNVEAVKVDMGRGAKLGIYTLIVKAADTERILHREKIAFWLEGLSIEDVRLHFRDWYGNKQLESAEIVVRKKGNLPVVIEQVKLTSANIVATSNRLRDPAVLDERTTVKVAGFYSRPIRARRAPGSGLYDISGSFSPGTYKYRLEIELFEHPQRPTFEGRFTVP